MYKGILKIFLLIFAFTIFCLVNKSTVFASANTEPIINSSDLQFVGAFRVPFDQYYGSVYGFNFSGSPLAYNPTNNSLFIGSLESKIAEISIPTPVNSSTLTNLPTATVLQNFTDITEGHLDSTYYGGAVGPRPQYLNGMVVNNGQIVADGYVYFDTNNGERAAHMTHSTNLSTPGFNGWFTLLDSMKQGLVGGQEMSNIPTEWQSILGGTILTGGCCFSIITRTSSGPSAFSFDPVNLTGPVYPNQSTPITANPLLYYWPVDLNATYTTLGRWLSNNSVYGGNATVGGAVIIPGTRTVLYIGRVGQGTFCYGGGTSNINLDWTIDPNTGGITCYDPTTTAKSPHSYPYVNKVWAYDLNDFAAVKAGTKNPWDLLPYATWNLTPPINFPGAIFSAVAYDPTRQLIYISQYSGESGPSIALPLIQVYHVSIGSQTVTEPGAVLSVDQSSTDAGKTIVLTWHTTNATSISISGVGTVAANGTMTVTPPVGDTKYILTASNAAGTNTQSAGVHVFPIAPNPPTATMTASPTAINSGGSSTLTWSTSGASQYVTINSGGGGADVTPSGTMSVSPTVTTTYVLSATNNAGTTNVPVTVTVNGTTGGPNTPTATLTASPTNISSGSFSTLSWSTTNATSVSISPTIGAVAASGSVGVSPTTSTTYTITATNSSGSVTSTATVTVAGAPAPAPGSLVGYWKFDESSGTNVSDSSGLGNNGSVVGSASWSGGKYGNAFNFNGSTEIDIPSASSINNSQFTIDTWIKFTGLAGIIYGNVSSGIAGLLITSDGHLGSIAFNFQLYGNSTGVVPLNTWTKVTLVYDGTNASFYINGAPSGSGPAAFSTSYMGTTQIGKGLTQPYFTGSMDELRLYNGTLTSTEISNLYQYNSLTAPGTLLGDLNHDHIVNSLDWSIMNSKWFTNDANADLNHDGLVNAIDFSILNANWFKTG